jgi:hypothetical protein
MRILFAISILFLIASCQTPQELFDSGVNKIEKAIERDSTLSFPTDTIRTIRIDTIPGADGKDSIIREIITEQIPCDFTLEDLQDLRTKSRRELRHERKMYKDSLKHQEKMYKLETKRLEDSLQQMNKHYKQEVKALKSDNATEVKLAKQDTKQKRGSWFTRAMGKIWWLLLIIGLVLGIYVSRFIPKIPNPFKQKQDG